MAEYQKRWKNIEAKANGHDILRKGKACIIHPDWAPKRVSGYVEMYDKFKCANCDRVADSRYKFVEEMPSCEFTNKD